MKYSGNVAVSTPFIEVIKLKTYPFSESLVDAKKGSHWVLAAIADGEVVGLRYIEDVSPLSADHLDGPNAPFFIQQWLRGTGVRSTDVHEIKALGALSIGKCSGREFIET